ncbi:MAG: hypothetical protein ACLR17_14975 [Enterobacteriaceae bacterium]
MITADRKSAMPCSRGVFPRGRGSLAISGIALPLVSIIGKGNEQVGYFGAMCVLADRRRAVVCVLLHDQRALYLRRAAGRIGGERS